MIEEPLVSVIIINYNGLGDLEEFFDSILNLTYKNVELIIVDNNSQDNSVEIIQKNYPIVKIVELKKNYGFAKGNNLGMPFTKGKYIVLLNMDTVVDKNWLTELVKVAEQSNYIGIIGSKIYYYDNREIIDFAGGSSDIYGKTFHIGMSNKDNEILNKKKTTFYICGASLLIKRELYDKIGLFDPIYFAYFEDVDLCWRAWMIGYKVIFAPKSFLYHKISTSFKIWEIKKQYTEKNRLRTVLKNYELKTLIKILPGYFSDILNEILRFRRFNPPYYKKYVNMYLKVILWNFLHIFSLFRYRFIIQSIRKKDDDYILSVMKN